MKQNKQRSRKVSMEADEFDKIVKIYTDLGNNEIAIELIDGQTLIYRKHATEWTLDRELLPKKENFRRYEKDEKLE